MLDDEMLEVDDDLDEDDLEDDEVEGDDAVEEEEDSFI